MKCNRLRLTASPEHSREVYSKALGSEREWQNLDRISDGQRSEGDIIKGEEDEKEGDCGTSGRLDGVLGERRAERSDNDERGQHTAS